MSVTNTIGTVASAVAAAVSMVALASVSNMQYTIPPHSAATVAAAAAASIRYGRNVLSDSSVSSRASESQHIRTAQDDKKDVKILCCAFEGTTT